MLASRALSHQGLSTLTDVMISGNEGVSSSAEGPMMDMLVIPWQGRDQRLPDSCALLWQAGAMAWAWASWTLKLECRWMQDIQAWPWCKESSTSCASERESEMASRGVSSSNWRKNTSHLMTLAHDIHCHKSHKSSQNYTPWSCCHLAKFVATGDVSCQLLQLLSGWIGAISRVVDCRDLNPGS